MTTVLVGTITCKQAWDKPIVVAAYARQNGALSLSHYTVLHEAGGYELIVPKGEYTIIAFGDGNANLTLDAGEPAGQYSDAVMASGSGTVMELNFAISHPAQTELAVGTQLAKPGPGKLHSTQVGAIADLQDPVFSAEAGRRGYWSPLEFFKETGGNIYFLEEYDPKKIPVLFVHGVAGSPQDWRYYFDHLDKTRYQAWFFYYPSGASLESMSYLLFWKLLNLQRRYQFDTIYFTAHSMGGLVVRSFLGNHGAYFPPVKMFLSLSTPWGGDDMADAGVRYSPAVIPSWKDVRAQGPFIQKLFREPLPRELDYYLFFGHGGSYSLLRSGNTDGSITLASQLRPDAQADARMVKGFNESHVSILSSPETFRQYAAVLKTVDKKHLAQAAENRGKLRLTFNYGDALDLPKTEPLLLLTPLDGQAGNTEKIPMQIRNQDSGRIFDALPPGDYEARLISIGYKTMPEKIRLSLSVDKTPELNFSLRPTGVLSAYIGANLRPSDNPAGSYRPPNQDIVIESISLSNGKHSRKLMPDKGYSDKAIENYLAGKDYLFQSTFTFVDLEEGDYEVSIEASGYQTYRRTYHVIPGQFNYWNAIDLIPLQANVKK